MTRKYLCALQLLVLLSFLSVASAQTDSDPERVTIIRVSYDTHIRPIFEKKCFDCHAETKKPLPWYAKLPIAKQIIEHDIKDARKDLIMTKGFPFEGSGSNAKDIKEIIEVVEKNEMPPWQYLLFHRSNKLTDEERNKVLQWGRNSLKIFAERRQ